MKPWLSILINVLAFDVAWTAGIFAAANGHAWWGAAALLANVALHLAMVPSRLRVREAALILCGALAGAAADSASLSAGVIGFGASNDPTPGFLVFFFALWASFGTTLRVALSWTWDRLWIGALLGLIGGPVAYLIGDRIGAISLPKDRSFSLAVIALQFGTLTPLWLAGARRTFRGAKG